MSFKKFYQMNNATYCMTTAHAMTRDILRDFPTANYHATLALCLRAAWDDRRTTATTTDDRNDDQTTETTTARAEWDAMTGDAQYNALIAMVWHMRDRDMAGTDRDGNEYAPRMAWIVTTDDAQSCAAEAWARMGALLDRNDDDKPLALILSKAVMRAAQYIDRAEKRHANALRLDQTTDDDGNKTMHEYIDTTRTTAERIAPAPDVAYEVKDAIERAAHDDRDRAIIAMLAQGYNQTEIAYALNVSKMAVSKRVDRIRDRYTNAETA